MTDPEIHNFGASDIENKTLKQLPQLTWTTLSPRIGDGGQMSQESHLLHLELQIRMPTSTDSADEDEPDAIVADSRARSLSTEDAARGPWS